MKVMVIDEQQPFSASKAASGIINPVTGRRIVRTWMIEEIMPFAVDAYTQVGSELGETLISQCNVIDFHPTPQMKISFEKRLNEETFYLKKPAEQDQWTEFFNYDFGAGEIDPCWLVELHPFLNGWRKKLKELDELVEEKFDFSTLDVSQTGSITYKNITAKNIIFCEGVSGFTNPYFELLPYTKMKGEALIAEIPGLPRTNIFKQGISIVPWQDGLFWIGSSYEWDFTDPGPTAIFRERTEAQLNHWLKIPYKIVDHIASERPANIERRPFVGMHPSIPTVGLLNGMGAKGCSLAPYFAHQFVEHLTHNTPINPLADVQRFSRILSAKI